MVNFRRGLFILPLLFVYGNSQFLFPDFGNPLEGYKNEGRRVRGGAPVGGDSNARGVIPEPLTRMVAEGGIVEARTEFKGSWELFVQDSGVSAMHVQLLPNVNQVLIFDATIWLKSFLPLPPPCRKVKNSDKEDCFCHVIIMDIETGQIRPLRKVETDTWCSSGALDVNGRLVSTGGFSDGSDTVRILDICPTCDWQEYPRALGNGRWYSTQVTLADGRFMIFGGRGMRSYEFVPPEGQKNTRNEVYPFQFLVETDDPEVENNLYPFVYLSTDGNLFIFANNRSILLDPNTHKVIHEFPVLPNGARNYPASAGSCLLPILLQPNEARKIIPVDVLICGGAPHDAYFQAEKLQPKIFLPANTDCARMDITKRNGKWKIINMPSARVMGDAALLPMGDVLIINGAKRGTGGWNDAIDPNFTPVLYKFKGDGTGPKFTVLNPSNIPRMYHSSFALLPDSKILVAGSNTHNGYFTNVEFPTEVRVEKFSPHYLDPGLDQFRQEIIVEKSINKVKYGQKFNVQISEIGVIEQQNLQVTIYCPPFTTHAISMNQRLIQLAIEGFNAGSIALQAPINGNIAPPGYYMLFVNYKAVPCRRAMWIQITP